LVTIRLEFQGFAVSVKNLLFNIMSLIKCPKNRQHHEAGRKQGKFRSPEIFSAELSPETGDSFPLATAPVQWQPGPRIDVV
jgi:hypothetical protein